MINERLRDILLKNVYYFDNRAGDVKEGVCNGVGIKDDGYLVMYIVNKKGMVTIDFCHAFKTKKLAEEWKKQVMPLITKANNEVKASKKKVDDIRIAIIGKPYLTK